MSGAGDLMRTVVIGTGPAGISAAETLRRLDPSGSVVALSTEPFPPYSPPSLADHFLTGRDAPLYWKGRRRLTNAWASRRSARRGWWGSIPKIGRWSWPTAPHIGFEGLVLA